MNNDDCWLTTNKKKNLNEIKIGWILFRCILCFVRSALVKNDEQRQVDDYCLSFVQCYNFDYHFDLPCVYANESFKSPTNV